MADILAHEIIARDRNKVAFAHITQGIQKARHAQRNRCLACAGIAGETHVQSWRFMRQAKLLAAALHQKQGRCFTDALLHGLEAHQITVQCFKDLGYTGILKLTLQVEGGACVH